MGANWREIEWYGPCSLSFAMKYDHRKERTRRFALQVVQAMTPLHDHPVGAWAAHQGIRSSMSVACNYRAACRAKSKADFIAKMGTVEEESDEAEFWLGVLVDLHALDEKVASPLRAEAGEITAIVVASINTARGGSR